MALGLEGLKLSCLRQPSDPPTPPLKLFFFLIPTPPLIQTFRQPLLASQSIQVATESLSLLAGGGHSKAYQGCLWTFELTAPTLTLPGQAEPH